MDEILTGAHPYAMCICIKCGPPWRDARLKPPADDRIGALTWGSYMALCPRCGSKRCSGAGDHENPCRP